VVKYFNAHTTFVNVFFEKYICIILYFLGGDMLCYNNNFISNFSENR